MPKLVFLSSSIVVLIFFCSLGALKGEDGSSAITQAYKSLDVAYAAIDAEGMTAFFAPSLTITDEKGASRVLSHAEQLKAARYAVRTEPGKRFVRRQVRSLKGTDLDGDQAHTRGTMIQELVSTDQAGTVVYVRFCFHFRDEWQRSTQGWRMRSSQVVGPIEKTAAAQPSPMLLGMIANMRESNAMLRNFNDANNFSTCMHATHNERFDYETRKTYCTP